MQEFGQSLKDFGEVMGSSIPYFDAVIKLGINEKLIGQQENELCVISGNSFYFPLRELIQKECKRMHEDKKLVDSKRLDFEIIKGKHNKANSSTPQYEKMTADVESMGLEFKNLQERLLKVLNVINDTLMTRKSFFVDLVSNQIQYHTKALEFLNYSKEDFKSLTPTSKAN